MDVHTLNRKGFTLLEMCVVVFIISLLTVVMHAGVFHLDSAYYGFYDQYLFLQSQAMTSHTRVNFDTYPITFNEKGNIKQARTISFERHRTIILELGGGRLVYQ